MEKTLNGPIIAGILVVFAGVILTVSLGLWSQKGIDPTLPETVDFNFHIRPILSQNCFVCHGPDSSTREAAFRLDNFESATARLDHGGAPIVPGRPGKSLLIGRISSDDPGFRMPPPRAKKTLTSREIDLMRRWIAQGAQWKQHWALLPPEKPDKSHLVASPSEIIDHLVDEKLIENRLVKAGPADKNSLIRRTSYLLTGLPPVTKDLEEFISDNSESSFETIVDKYLASPPFGERWARHWMDLVRYAESMGHQGDYDISHAWEYRDYLIRAFNADVPYDQLVKEHLAGDMLSNPRYHPEQGFNESVIGTGYFFLGQGEKSPVNIKLEEANKIDNMIDVTSKTFLALTVGCARCHDHKFDPIPTTDYYAMYGMIESSRLGPIPARSTLTQQEQIKKLRSIQNTIRTEVGRQLKMTLENAGPEFINKQKRFFQNLPTGTKSDIYQGDHKMLVDFRSEECDDWYFDGFGFGDGPLRGEPIIDRKSNRAEELKSGFASSRFFGTGVQGVLRSPNFIIEHDSLAVRAAGNGGLIRIVIDNFQLIQRPLWGEMEVAVNDPEWRIYKFDVSRAKGHKAYLQFTPGHYGEPGDHVYRIKPEDYVEIEYAVAYDQGVSESHLQLSPDRTAYSLESQKSAVERWVRNEATRDQIDLVDGLLRSYRPQLPGDMVSRLKTFDTISPELRDSTHFIGMSEGDAVFSPVFIRGSVDYPSKEKVPRSFLSAIKAGPHPFPQEGSGRLAWAQALVDPANPLTSRVMVNRIWHHIFGRGIVETVDNFGGQGKLPTHPELLDYLALKFIEEGWSVKKMIKHILLTETYGRSTEVIEANLDSDPDNYYLHHFPIRRLEAEAIRDGMLAVSRRLNRTMYGKPVPVHLTPFMTGRGRPFASGPLDGDGRRSIYIAIRRNFLSPMMTAFDLPTPFTTFGRRSTTNVPAQSLTLMNDPFVKGQATFWAEQLLSENHQTPADRIKAIYRRAFCREAQPAEVQKGIDLLETQARTYGSSLEDLRNDSKLWAGYCHAVFNLKEFVHLL